jgi:hypothetical protein
LAEKDRHIRALEGTLGQREARIKDLVTELEGERREREKRERKGIKADARAGVVGFFVGVPLNLAGSLIKGFFIHHTATAGALTFVVVYLSFAAYVACRMVLFAARTLKAAAGKGRVEVYAVRSLYSFTVAFALVMTVVTNSGRVDGVTNTTTYRCLLLVAGGALVYNFMRLRQLCRAKGEGLPTLQQIINWSV